MKELQEIIIGTCFGEDQYKKVSFLEPEDFDNFPSKPYRDYFKLLKDTGADELCLVNALSICKDKNLKLMLGQYVSSLGVNCIDRYAVKLLEIRFQTLLASLLYDLSIQTKKDAERDLLNEASLLIVSSDIFDLSDYLIEYLGAHASDYTKRRINNFLDYRNKRIATAKKVINELN